MAGLGAFFNVAPRPEEQGSPPVTMEADAAGAEDRVLCEAERLVFQPKWLPYRAQPVRAAVSTVHGLRIWSLATGAELEAVPLASLLGFSRLGARLGEEEAVCELRVAVPHVRVLELRGPSAVVSAWSLALRTLLWPMLLCVDEGLWRNNILPLLPVSAWCALRASCNRLNQIAAQATDRVRSLVRGATWPWDEVAKRRVKELCEWNTRVTLRIVSPLPAGVETTVSLGSGDDMFLFARLHSLNSCYDFMTFSR